MKIGLRITNKKPSERAGDNSGIKKRMIGTSDRIIVNENILFPTSPTVLHPVYQNKC